LRALFYLIKITRMSKKRETVTLKEALKITGFSRSTFNNRIAAGKIAPLPKPAGLLKRPVLEFYRADVEKLISE